jgi:hypothetical protein
MTRKRKTFREVARDLGIAEQMTRESDAPNCKCQDKPAGYNTGFARGLAHDAVRPDHKQVPGVVFPKTRKKAMDVLATHGIMIYPNKVTVKAVKKALGGYTMEAASKTMAAAIRPGNTQLVGAMYNDKPEPRENDAVTTYYKFIKFVMVERKPKTNVYECYNTRHGALLGVVKWYGPWRRYCFWPQPNCIFSAECMDDVAQFINNRTD